PSRSAPTAMGSEAAAPFLTGSCQRRRLLSQLPPLCANPLHHRAEEAVGAVLGGGEGEVVGVPEIGEDGAGGDGAEVGVGGEEGCHLLLVFLGEQRAGGVDEAAAGFDQAGGAGEDAGLKGDEAVEALVG